jgi:hypothetical protein
MRFDWDDFDYRLGIALLWFVAFLLVVILAIFHLVAISFLVPSWFELDIVSRGFAFVLVGGFCVFADIVSYRYVKGRMDRSRWTAEIQREHESRNN